MRYGEKLTTHVAVPRLPSQAASFLRSPSSCAISVAALTIYDMAKAIDRGMTITEIRLESKKGGKSGTYKRK